MQMPLEIPNQFVQHPVIGGRDAAEYFQTDTMLSEPFFSEEGLVRGVIEGVRLHL
jgi:hypothetical protein